MKYKLDIHNGFSSVYASVLDENDNWVCHLNFNKKHIESLGNRYDKDGMSNASWELDVILNQTLCKIQDKLGLAESLDTSS
jgi:hypothetical protein